MLTTIREHFLFLFYNMKSNSYLFILFILLFSIGFTNAQISIDLLDNDKQKENIEKIDSIPNSDLQYNIENYSRQIYVPAPNNNTNYYENINHQDQVIIAPTQTFIDINWNDFLKLVDSTGKKYFVQFTASWCGPCKMMDKEVFKKKAVIEMANSSYLAKQIDIDDFDGVQITQDLKIRSIPSTIIFDCNGKELKRIEGFQYEDMFLNTLKRYE